jgi:toxin ParE1/3/4
MTYRFHPAAEAEHLGQIAFYESRRKGLGGRYRDHFLKIVQGVCERPAQYPIGHPPDIRRVRLRPFPLTLIYRERDGAVEILALAHYRRRPGYWLGRMAETKKEGASSPANRG